MWGLGSELGIWGIIIALGAAQALKAVSIYCLSQRQLFMPYQLKLLTVNITSLFIFLYIAFHASDLWLCTIIALLSPIFSLLPTLLIKEVNQWVTNKVMSKSADNDVLQPGESSHCGSDR